MTLEERRAKAAAKKAAMDPEGKRRYEKELLERWEVRVPTLVNRIKSKPTPCHVETGRRHAAGVLAGHVRERRIRDVTERECAGRARAISRACVTEPLRDRVPQEGPDGDSWYSENRSRIRGTKVRKALENETLAVTYLAL